MSFDLVIIFYHFSSLSLAFRSAPKLVVPAFSISFEGASFLVEVLGAETFFSSFNLESKPKGEKKTTKTTPKKEASPKDIENAGTTNLGALLKAKLDDGK